MATTTTHNQQDRNRAGTVAPLGFELTWPDGSPYLDPETDAADQIPARWPTRADAVADGVLVGDWAADHLGLPWTLTAVPAGTRPAPRPAPSPTAPAPASTAPEVVRTTIEYAIRLPDGSLWRDADAQVAGWDATYFLIREDAENAADKLTAEAAEAGIRGYRAAVATRTITTTVSNWH